MATNNPRKIEIDFALPPNNNMASKMAQGIDEDEKVVRYDFHSWVVKKDGSIYDCDTIRPALVCLYDAIALVRLGHSDYSFVHKEWRETPTHLKKRKTELREAIEWLPPKMLWSQFADNYGYCHQRAIIIDMKNKTTRVAYGSLGLQDNKTKKIWWEHGDGR
tara:strand:+ start:417 stop:902 length:486 start_codon:yes stop_codon:yes gene_type:complete